MNKNYHKNYLNSSGLAEIARYYGHGKERKTREGYLTLCPCHDDKNPSCSLKLGDNDNLIVNCFHGCDPIEIKKKIECDLPHLFSRNGAVKKESPFPSSSLRKSPTKWQDFYDKGTSCFEHPYLKQKGFDSVNVRGLRCYQLNGNSPPSLLVPMYDKDGRHVGTQSIYPATEGKGFRKVLLKGSKKKGSCFEIQGDDPPIICEGLADGISINKSTERKTIVAFDAGNIPHVAERYPDAVIGADNDKAGIDAAEKAGLPYFLPGKFKDFNDLYCAQGKEAIRKIFEREPVRPEAVGIQDDFEVPRVPEWDPRAFSGIFGEFVKVATVDSEADPLAVLLQLQALFAASLGREVYLTIGNKKRYARINAVLVGDSSKARKGTSFDPVEVLFKRIEEATEYKPSKIEYGPFSSGEGIIYAIRDETLKWKPATTKEGEGKFIVEDPGVEDKRLFVYEEEFAGLLSATKRKGNILSMIIRKMWDSGDVSPITKSNRIKVTGGHLCWVGHITIEELEEQLSETEAVNGFGNRILWAYVRRRRLVPRPKGIPENKLTDFAYRFKEIFEWAKGKGEIALTAEAWNYWEKIYPILTESRPGLFGRITGRAEIYTLILALIYAVADMSDEIDVEHLESALALWNCCEDSARFIFYGLSENKYERKLLEALKEGPLTKTQIVHDVFQGNLKKEKIAKIIARLKGRGLIEEESQPTKGRPITIFKYTPTTKTTKPTKDTTQTDTKELKSFKSFKSYRDFENNGNQMEADLGGDEIVEIGLDEEIDD